MTEKILGVVEGFIKEEASIWFPYKGFGRPFKKYRGSFYRALEELTKRGYLEVIELEGEKYLRTTPKGKLKLLKKKIFHHWDGLWRIIAFDIPEEKRDIRNQFRETLRRWDCLPIQKSVWITPYDISADLEELIEILDVYECVDYFISKALTNESKYRSLFNLETKD